MSDTDQMNFQPSLLVKAMKDAGMMFDALTSSQIILVLAQGASAELHCFEKDNQAIWRFNDALSVTAGFVGRNGICTSKTEGDGCTPTGIFRLGYAFGVNEKPETKMAFKKVTGNSYWVDDARSRYYNTWVEGHDDADWASAERLGDYPREYAYAVVIEYNTAERKQGKGSAVFLHCGSKPTSGCIAVPETALLEIFKWLDPEKSPVIIITDIS